MRLISAVAAFAVAAGLTSAAQAGDTVLVVGGGRSGMPLVKILSEQGYTVRLSVRDPSKAEDLPADVEVVKADVTEPETLTSAVKGISYVISTIGSGRNAENVDYKGVAALADAAKAAGVKHMVLMSSMNAGNDDPEERLNKMFSMVLMWKGKGEDHLRKSGMPYTIVRPGGLKNCDPGATGLKLMPGGSNELGMICRADVGLVMADALTNKNADGKTVAVIGDETAKPGEWKKSWKALPKD